MSYIIFHKNDVFQARAEAFLLLRRFEAEIFQRLFLDYREKYALLFNLYRFYCILQIFDMQKYVRKNKYIATK